MGGASDSPQSVKISLSAGSKSRVGREPTHKRPAEGTGAAPMAREGSAGFTSRPRRATGLPPHPLSPSPLGRPGHGAGRGDLGYLGAPDPLKNLLKVSRPRHQETNRNSEAQPQRETLTWIYLEVDTH